MEGGADGDWREEAGDPDAHFDASFNDPDRTRWAGPIGPEPPPNYDFGAEPASQPADLLVLAAQVQRILDEEARRFGIDV